VAGGIEQHAPPLGRRLVGGDARAESLRLGDRRVE
jgi:hypothetical protein